MPEIKIIPPPTDILLFKPVQFKCQFVCDCGEVVTYYDENGKPERLIKCWECVQDEARS